MCPDENKTNIGAEYICWDSDDLWKTKDADLVILAAKELEQIGLVDSALVEGGLVMRNRYAYPVYHLDYKEDLDEIFAYLAGFKNLQTIGRAGLYRYNNMDHSILSGFYAARNILGDKKYNVLEINADKEYSETEKNNK
jgi:protoporphyrinogen oxidase